MRGGQGSIRGESGLCQPDPPSLGSIGGVAGRS